MGHDPDSTPLGRRMLRLMRIDAMGEGKSGLAALSHSIRIQNAANLPPTSYTVILASDDHGTFLVTCRELPEVTTFGENEEEALLMAELAIKEALGDRRSSPDFPY